MALEYRAPGCYTALGSERLMVFLFIANPRLHIGYWLVHLPREIKAGYKAARIINSE